MSKGHAAVALYSCLASSGYFGEELLDGFGSDGTPLAGHVTAGLIAGVEVSAGSLGHGLSLATGIALSLAHQQDESRVFCLISDGECQEGSTWEAALLASHWSLPNLHVVIDANGQQGLGAVEAIANLEPLADKWLAFGWSVTTVDGHDLVELEHALSRRNDSGPCVTIARTIKGKGVSFMEDQLQWHYKSPNEEQVNLALAELGNP
jgi:transketolase